LTLFSLTTEVVHAEGQLVVERNVSPVWRIGSKIVLARRNAAKIR
jgi:hypothetical protein